MFELNICRETTPILVTSGSREQVYLPKKSEVLEFIFRLYSSPFPSFSSLWKHFSLIQKRFITNTYQCPFGIIFHVSKIILFLKSENQINYFIKCSRARLEHLRLYLSYLEKDLSMLSILMHWYSQYSNALHNVSSLLYTLRSFLMCPINNFFLKKNWMEVFFYWFILHLLILADVCKQVILLKSFGQRVFVELHFPLGII